MDCALNARSKKTCNLNALLEASGRINEPGVLFLFLIAAFLVLTLARSAGESLGIKFSLTEFELDPQIDFHDPHNL